MDKQAKLQKKMIEVKMQNHMSTKMMIPIKICHKSSSLNILHGKTTMNVQVLSKKKRTRKNIKRVTKRER